MRSLNSVLPLSEQPVEDVRHDDQHDESSAEPQGSRHDLGFARVAPAARRLR